MNSTTKLCNGMQLLKSMVEEVLSDMLKAEIEVYPNDERLLAIYNKIKTEKRDIEKITLDEVKDEVIKHYVAGYINSKEVIEDIEIN